jgi:amino acid transporter
MIFGFKIYARKWSPHEAHGIRPTEADFYLGKDAIDREEEEYLAAQAAKGGNKKAGKFYKRYIGWLI